MILAAMIILRAFLTVLIASFVVIPSAFAIDKLDLSVLEQFLDHTTKRQEILAKNIADGDTPGKKALDIEKFKPVKNSHSQNTINLATTHNNHMSGKHKSNIKVVKQPGTHEVKPNGNNISISKQMQEVSKTQLDYSFGIQAYIDANDLQISALGK